MTEDQFVRERRPRWDALGALLERLGRSGLDRLPPREVVDFGALYQAAVADLALARSRFGADGPTARYVNALVARAAARVYRARRLSARGLVLFFAGPFQAVLASRRREVLAAMALFLAAALAGFILEELEPGAARAFFARGAFDEMERRLAEGEASGADWSVAVRPVVAARILANNLNVAVLAMAAGLAFGVGTAAVLVANGLLLGLLAGVFHAHGAHVPFWAHILPHGVLELAAVFLAGGAGFVLGGALLRPGRATRLAALRDAGGDALALALGAAPLLAVAALLEGFVTPSSLGQGWKLAVAALSALPLAAYLRGRAASGAGRQAEAP